MEYYTYNTCDSPFGSIVIISDGSAVVCVKPELNVTTDYKKEADKLTDQTAKQLEEYFSGKRREFTVPLCPPGTTFQRSVWEALKDIPYGETRSYKQVAQMIGNPKASRAVGLANSKNPIWILIPCHRVVGADGTLTGYAGGLDMKKRLLEIEKG